MTRTATSPLPSAVRKKSRGEDMSWRELYERYDELKDLTEEQLIEKLGGWWGPIFFESKEEIRKTLWRRNDDKSSDSCGKDYCEL